MKTPYLLNLKSMFGGILAFFLVAFTLSGSFAQTQTPNYCYPAPKASFKNFIQKVVFDGINNPSGHDNGYGDYTNLIAEVKSGNTYPIILKPKRKAPYDIEKSYWRVWIDYNADGDFNDTGELVVQRNGFDTIMADITIPQMGSVVTRMRIIQSLFAYQKSCALFDRGEVEDYSVSINTCEAISGTITADATPVCLTNGSAVLSATPAGDAFVPPGYSTVFVLTSGSGLVIEQAGGTPSFTVNAGGMYTIHTLVYDPNTLDLSIVVPGVTTGFDVNALLTQGGGSICASLDVAGAMFNVEAPDAGTITADATPVCLTNGSAVLSATPAGDAFVPPGYSTVFVLTSGSGLVIEQAGGTPSFTVNAGGMYTIHTLVYDPNTLDLSIVVPGVTTGFDVNALLTQGGGSICASLDVAGAMFDVEAPDAGTLVADKFINCLQLGSMVQLTAIPAGNVVVPQGYQTIFVLTRGPGLVIEQAGTSPSFSVQAFGLYRIHTLVYDPNTLDLNIVVPGVTTGFDVNALLVQGGGSICASLDVQGATFIVIPNFICNLLNIGKVNPDMQDPQAFYDELMDSYSRNITSVNNDLEITVYPNPAQEQININFNSNIEENIEIEVVNSVGQKMLQINNVTNINNIIDISSWPSGVYIVNARTEKNITIERFIKK